MELLLAKGDSVDDVISKIGNGDAEAVSGRMIEGITTVGFDVKA